MELTQEAIGAYETILKNPSKYNMPFRAITEMFETSETVRASHLLFEDFSKEVPNCPKLIFYIVMNNLHGLAMHKDEEGRLGYKLKYKEAL